MGDQRVTLLASCVVKNKLREHVSSWPVSRDPIEAYAQSRTTCTIDTESKYHQRPLKHREIELQRGVAGSPLVATIERAEARIY